MPMVNGFFPPPPPASIQTILVLSGHLQANAKQTRRIYSMPALFRAIPVAMSNEPALTCEWVATDQSYRNPVCMGNNCELSYGGCKRQDDPDVPSNLLK
mmetsp:Transcript_5176/g.10715  ORF Transcript_5176/g.10715 Transcript_5176/m.10715 type:complete len:99 (-) Transcript_5176:705-1001(-)